MQPSESELTAKTVGYSQRTFQRLSFSRQFVLLGAVTLVVAAVLINQWIGRSIERNALNRAAHVASVYVESILSLVLLHGWSPEELKTPDARSQLDSVFIDGPLSRKIVRFKLWSDEGRILYSSDHAQLDKTYPVEGQLKLALDGHMQATISSLDDPDNAPEKARWQHLLEVYVPIQATASSSSKLVAEFYYSMENLDREIAEAQTQSTFLVAIGALIIFLALYGLIYRANRTIIEQRNKLQLQLQRLRNTLTENERIQKQLSQAGALTTSLNEELLQRTAADLHDGPAQQLAFALLRFEAFENCCRSCNQTEQQAGGIGAIQDAMQNALTELRAIASGLGVPGLAELDLSATIKRAIRDAAKLFAQPVTLSIPPELGDAPPAVKITSYRVIQEALTNSARYAKGEKVCISVTLDNGILTIEIADQGPGFDLSAHADCTRLGLNFMRERVRLLGGQLDIESAIGRGTSIHAVIPLNNRASHE